MNTCPECGKEVQAESGLCSECQANLQAPAPMEESGVFTTKGLRTSKLAVLAFMVSIVPLFVIDFLGIFIGLIAVDQINKRPLELKGRGWAIAAIMIGSLMAYLAFMIFSMRSEMRFHLFSEAKSNLGAIQVAEKTYYEEHHVYADSFQAITWNPEGKNRYAYILPGETIYNLRGDTITGQLPAGIAPAAGPNSFTALAIGNLDQDDTLEIWAINEKKELRNLVQDIPREDPMNGLITYPLKFGFQMIKDISEKKSSSPNEKSPSDHEKYPCDK